MAEQTEPGGVGASPAMGTWGVPSDEPLPPAEYGVVEYFGEPVRVLVDLAVLEIDFEEFMDEAHAVDVEDDVRAAGLVRAFLRRLVHPDDWGTFWRLVRTHRQGLNSQMEFAQYVLGLLGGRPTEPSSTSVDGRSSTEQNSADDFSSRAQAALEGQGRPDLAVAVLNAREGGSLN